MEITAIEPRRKRLSQLYLDGEAAVKVDTETLIKAGWKPGMEISDEELHQLLQESEARRAKEKALYLLEYRSPFQKGVGGQNQPYHQPGGAPKLPLKKWRSWGW